MILARNALVQMIKTPSTNHVFRTRTWNWTSVWRRPLGRSGITPVASIQRSGFLPPGLSRISWFIFRHRLTPGIARRRTGPHYAAVIARRTEDRVGNGLHRRWSIPVRGRRRNVTQKFHNIRSSMMGFPQRPPPLFWWLTLGTSLFWGIVHISRVLLWLAGAVRLTVRTGGYVVGWLSGVSGMRIVRRRSIGALTLEYHGIVRLRSLRLR
jgi:hypothetical protein